MAGNVVAHPDKTKGVRRVGDKLMLAKVSELSDFRIAEAVRQRSSQASSRFVFTAGPDKVEYTALFSNFPAGFAKQWEVLIVTPTDDFVGDLKQTNRRLFWLVIGLTALESALIYFMVRLIAQPIERAAEQIQRIRSLTLDAPGREQSRVREIARLQGAVRLLHNALRSFSVFVPVGIVRELIESGKPLAPGVEARFMTVFFSDLENFSTIAETLSPEELSRQVTMYFESVTDAISLERGTIDKFIGDSVMAFWGAPAPCEDHVWLGCRAALRASNRMRRLNELWRTEGRRTMRLRVGLHCANVVVGSIGSAERLSYTVMGDGVNVASRLEGVNKQFGTSICISASVYEQVADRALTRPIQRLSVKGRAGEFLVYELLGIVGNADPELQPRPGDEERSRLTTAALSFLDQGRFADAVAAYDSVLAAFPDDGLAQTMRDVAAEAATRRAPDRAAGVPVS
jgi:class 3 adenylate cyclase